MEFAVLIISYIFLSITVGASSMIALKQFSSLYFNFYKKNFDLFKYINIFYWLCYLLFSLIIKCLKRKKIFKRKKQKEKNLQQIFFYTFSIFSAFLIIVINRQIFKHFKKLKSKWILKFILIVYGSSFGLNLLFYFFYSVPLINLEFKKRKKEKYNIDNSEEKNIYIIDKSNENINIKDTEIVDIKNDIPINKEQINENKIYENIPVQTDANINDKNKKNYNKLNLYEISEVNNNNVPTKACTCCGYLFFQKKIGNKEVCIFYDYVPCYTWFWLKIKKPQIYGSFFIELFIQICSVGFNSALSNNILKVYSFSKNFKFFSTFTISFFFMIGYIYFFKENKFIDFYYADKSKYTISKIIFSDIIIVITFLVIYSIYTFVFSIIYLAKDLPTSDKWDNNLMSLTQFYKFIDLYMLSVYDFMDDSDFLNASVVITCERFLWMIIEVIIDTSGIKIKNLIIVQIVVSSLFSIILVILIIILICYLSDIIKQYKMKF